MRHLSASQGLRQYHANGVRTEAAIASPHRLIQMLMEGALARIATAKGLMAQGDVAGKGSQISAAIAIIGGLKTSLDPQRGGEIAANLGALYDYMEARLVEANARNAQGPLDEVATLLGQIKLAWDAIGEQQPAGLASAG
jgi:flagellar protein FliS